MTDRDRNPGNRGPPPTPSMMGGRIYIAYIGKHPLDVEEKEIMEVFSKYGQISEVSLRGNYCFVQYESSRDSKDAVREMNGKTLFGKPIRVEHAQMPRHERHKRSQSGVHRRPSMRRRSPQRRSDYRLAITNLSSRCDEHDFKAVMEKAGAVCFAVAHRWRTGEGVVEFVSKKGMEKALKKLNGLQINNKPIKLEILNSRSRSGSHTRYRSRSRSRSHSHSHSRSRSRSRTRSCSRSRSRSRPRSHSHSQSNSRRNRASSENSKEHSEDDQQSDKIKIEKDLKEESKSDDFEEAERNTERRNLSNNDVDIKKESDDKEFEEAERNVQIQRSHSKCMENADIKREDSDDPV